MSRCMELTHLWVGDKMVGCFQCQLPEEHDDDLHLNVDEQTSEKIVDWSTGKEYHVVFPEGVTPEDI